MNNRTAYIAALTNTGDDIQPVTFKELNYRVNRIKSRSKITSTRQSLEYSTINNAEKTKKKNTNQLQDVQTDHFSTNFNPQKPQIQTIDGRINHRNNTRKSVQLYSSDSQTRKRPMTSYRQSFKLTKALANVKAAKGESEALIFKEEMNQLKILYEHLASILGSINSNSIEEVERAISSYVNFIQSKTLSFIDDFMEGRQIKLQKVIRSSRLHQSLSIAYLFLEIAQERIENHQSYLTNFIGFCLANLLLMTRLYVLKQKQKEYEENQFQMTVTAIQLSSFAQKLTKVDDVLLRMQHNNEIITMMHKKLGRFNPKFQTCIQLFFKNAERKKTSCAQCTYYIFQYLALHIHQSELVGISKSLQTAPAPYCPPPLKKYTLIIQPLGILINQQRFRPYIFQFFEWASKYFDIVLWTWEMPYAIDIQKICSKLDEYLTSKLYRYHCIEENGIYVKDLSRLGRSLEKTLIIDYDKRIYYKQPKNGLELRWKASRSQPKDKNLPYLCQILQEMISSDSNVEYILQVYTQQLHSIKGF